MVRKTVIRKAGGGGSQVEAKPLETGRKVAKSNQGEKKGRRVAAGTAAAAAEALQQAAQGWPEPPPSLRASERPFWHAVMIARLPQQWAKVDLLHAANLARCLADIETNRAALLREGTLLKTASGPKINPRHALVETLNRRSMALTRVLQLHAVATIGEKGKQPGSKGDAGAAADALNKGKPTPKPGAFDPNELLARPRLQ